MGCLKVLFRVEGALKKCTLQAFENVDCTLCVQITLGPWEKQQRRIGGDDGTNSTGSAADDFAELSSELIVTTNPENEPRLWTKGRATFYWQLYRDNSVAGANEPVFCVKSGELRWDEIPAWLTVNQIMSESDKRLLVHSFGKLKYLTRQL